MRSGKWLSSNTQMYLITFCLGTVSQWMMKQGQLQGQSLISLMSVGLAKVNVTDWEISEIVKFILSWFLQFL